MILRNGSPEEFESELQGYLDHFRPRNPPERHLVQQLAAAGWRLARYAGVEAGLLNNKMEEQEEWVRQHHPGIPEKQRVALAFDALANSSPSLALANRYQARLHHEYQRVLKALLQLQNKPNSAAIPESNVGRSPWTAADAPVGPLDFSLEERVQGVYGPPHR